MVERGEVFVRAKTDLSLGGCLLMSTHKGNPTVAHLVSTYLFRTGSWIYNQIVGLSRYSPIVLCFRSENLGIFPLDSVYALYDLSLVRRFGNKVLHRIIGYYPFFRRIIRREAVQLIHAHFGPTGYHALPLAQACGLPLITTFYGYDLSRLPRKDPQWRSRYRHLFAKGALFLVEGSHMRQQLIELGCPPEKAVIQHLGVDLDKLRFQPRKPDPDGTVRVLVAGTFTEKKGIPYAVEAFARVRQEHDNVRLTVIGDARDRPDEQAIKQQLQNIVAQYGVEDSVTFMGYQPYPVLVEQLYQHHILVAPSVQAQDGDNEGGAPVTIIEALATGMPVLSTTHCDIPEVVLDDRSGYLVPERDVDSLADRLSQLVMHPERWSQMGCAGRRHVESEYDVVKQAFKLEHIYSRSVG